MQEGVRQTARGGVADGDMLIYELQGFSLTIPSFTETEDEERTPEIKKDGRKKVRKMQNWKGIYGKGMCREKKVCLAE